MTDHNRHEEVAQPHGAAQPGQRQAESASEARQPVSPNDAGTGNDPGTGNNAGTGNDAGTANAAGEETPGQPFVVRDKRRKPSPRPRADGGKPQQSQADSSTAPDTAAATADQPQGTAAEASDAAPPTEPVATETTAGGFAAEVQALRSELEERTKDLQRITAEYANYRRRIERDRRLVVEQATAGVLNELLGVLDDLDRARSHGDLVGPFRAVAEQLTSVLGKLGLAPFGEKGETFDPGKHEAVAHSMSTEVTEPTCVEVFRRGYVYGERLLRPALVAVADPAEQKPAVGVATVPEPQPKPAESAAGETSTEDRPAENASADNRSGNGPGGNAATGTAPTSAPPAGDTAGAAPAASAPSGDGSDGGSPTDGTAGPRDKSTGNA